VRTPEGVASLLYLMKVKERVAGARGQSADGNYIGVAVAAVNGRAEVGVAMVIVGNTRNF
jgi:hypothetical protein